MENIRLRKITAIWIVAVLVLFVAAITLGIIMRLNQAAIMKLSPAGFYENMTVHGLTMIGIWFVAGMAAVNFIMERYVKTSYSANLLHLYLRLLV